MLVYDKAHELARAFRSTPEFMTLKSTQERLKNDPQAFKMFLDYRRKEIAYQTAVMSGKQPEEAEVKNLQRLAEIVNLNSLVRDYIQAEARFGVIFSDIQRIIGDAVKEVSSLYTNEEEEGGTN